MRFSRRHFSSFLLIPSLIPLLLILAWPLSQVVYYSFTDLNLRRFQEYNYVGFDHFRRLFADPRFYDALFNSFVIAFWTLLFTAILGFALALLLNHEFRGRRLFRTITIIPWATPIVAATLIWAWILDFQFGILNWVIMSLGIISEGIGWYTDPNIALTAIIAITIWRNLPLVAIMLLSGLQSIDTGLYEAAKIDGAGPISRFRYVTLPGVKSISSIVLLLVTLWSFRELATVRILTNGGPARATETIVFYMYEQGFVSHRMGAASATGLVILAICLIFSVLYMSIVMGKKED